MLESKIQHMAFTFCLRRILCCLDVVGTIIAKEAGLGRQRSIYELDAGFRLEDVMYYCQDGIEVSLLWC